MRAPFTPYKTKRERAFIPAGRPHLPISEKLYLELETKRVTVFGSGEKLPFWFENYDWGVSLDYHQTSFLPPQVGLTEVELKNFSIKVSGAARALLECLYLVKENQDLLECYELMESLNNLRPGEVQTLLEKCRSVKVKRQFLYLAEKTAHRWFEYLDLSKIDLGSGKRSIARCGVYVEKYQITVPKEMENNDRNGL